MRFPLLLATFALLGVTACLVGSTRSANVAPKDARASIEQRRLLIQSGTIFTREGVPIDLSDFSAEIQSEKAAQGAAMPPSQIKDVLVVSGRVHLGIENLGKLLKARIKSDELTDLSVATDENELRISGTLKKAIPVHFAVKGPLTLTQDGLIDMRQSSVKVDKIPAKALSEMLGMDPAKVVGSSSSKGISATKDHIYLDPASLWGMSVRGKLTGVRVVKNGIVLNYGTPQKAKRASRQPVKMAKNLAANGK
jgi:hypothetical protein